MAAAARISFPRIVEKPVWSFNMDGSVMDMAAPDQASVCFHEIARSLSGIRRFNGRGMPVSQHLTMGAQAILNEGGGNLLAALFLLHDGHEWVIGDIIRPTESLLAALLASLPLREAIHRAKEGWDAAIYAAANLPMPEFWTRVQAVAVKNMDDRMCAAEAVALFGPRAAGQFPKYAAPKTTGPLDRYWPTAKAEEEFKKMLYRLIGEERIVSQAALAAASRSTRKS